MFTSFNIKMIEEMDDYFEKEDKVLMHLEFLMVIKIYIN